MELLERAFYDIDTNRRAPLLAPYDLLITLDGGIRIEVGRFSFAMLKKVRVIANGEDRCLLKIGSFCEAAEDATILVGGEHRNDSFLNYTFGDQGCFFRGFMPPEHIMKTTVRSAAPIEIGNNVVISTRAVVLSGTKIGCGSVIGAGAVVTSDCPPLGIYAGVPARRIRDRYDPASAELYRKTRFGEVMAHDVPKLPGLLDQLQRQEITLEAYERSVAFLPARPAVHFDSARLNDQDVILLGPVTGFSVGGEPVLDETLIDRLSRYFRQIETSEKLSWTADIFHTLGFY